MDGPDQSQDVEPPDAGPNDGAAQGSDEPGLLSRVANSKITLALVSGVVGACISAGVALGAAHVTADGARDGARITADDNKAGRAEARQVDADRVKREAADAFLDAVSEYATLPGSVITGVVDSAELPSAAIMSQFPALDKKANDAFRRVQSSSASPEAVRQANRLLNYATDLNRRLSFAGQASKRAYEAALATPQGPDRVDPAGAARFEMFTQVQMIGVQRLGHVGDCNVDDSMACLDDVRKQAGDGTWPQEPGRTFGDVKGKFRAAL